MPVSLIPYGQLPNGNYGVSIDPVTKKPLAAAVEILTGLPLVGDSSNFDGRMVFNLADTTLYAFVALPVPTWKSFQGVPTAVGNVGGIPPVIPVPALGSLYWDLDTQVLFVWDGAVWQAAGGKYAASIIETKYVGDGVSAVFATGAPVAVPVEYVEVFLDGVRQTTTADYNIVGTTVVFVGAIPAAVAIYIRTMVSDAVVQNSQVLGAQTTAVIGQTDFTTGSAGADPNGVFVFVNGIVQQLSTDYTFIQQDTTITSLTKTSPTVAQIVTAFPHGIPLGSPITLVGFSEPEYNNATFVVTNVVSITAFEISVAIVDAAAGTPNPIASFSPPYINDIVKFIVPMVGGELVDIRSLKSVVVGTTGVGEANTLASVGTGDSLVAPKLGTILQTKSLLAGANISIADLGNELSITANVGSGYVDRVGINTATYTVLNPTSYVGVRNTSAVVLVDLSGVAQLPANSGRTVTVKDESGGAGVNQITISAAPALIDGNAAPTLINTNYGSVTFVFDGNDWFVTAARP